MPHRGSTSIHPSSFCLHPFHRLRHHPPPPPPPPPTLPQWTDVPRGVLDAFCVRLRDEGISGEQVINVVARTQPLINAASIAGLAEASFYQKKFDPFNLAQEANRGAAAMPVAVPKGACAWQPVEESAARSVDTMTIEMSAPFVNPFARHSIGLFARISLAREAATWYWVPLVERDGRWFAARPMLMGMR